MGAPPPPSPSAGTAMACVVTSEVATVLAIMRRNVRYGGDEERLDHPLVAGLKSLRGDAAAWGPRRWRDVEPLLYLRPFLDVVRSDEAGAPATGAALSSLYKMLSLDLVGPDAPDAARAMAAVVEAVAGCRFEVTDPASEEAVLARVLLACVRGRVAPALSNRHVCDIVNTCFRVVQQAGAKGELLQRVSRQTMQEVVRCVFARLPDIDATAVADHKIAGSKNQGWSASDSVCLSSSQDEAGAKFGVVQDKAMMELFGVPCMVEILQFLCSLLNIAEDNQVDPNMNPIDFDEDMPLFALGLINSAIELSSSSIYRHPKLLTFVQDELFRNGKRCSPETIIAMARDEISLFWEAVS